MERVKGTAKPFKVGRSWFIRLRTYARVSSDGAIGNILSSGKLLRDESGLPVRRQFTIKVADIARYPKLGAGLDLVVARIKADIEAAERADGLVDDVRPDGDMRVADFFENVYMPYVRQQKELSTQRTYARYWTDYLADHFNHTKTLKNYETWMATAFLESKCKTLSENTVRHIRNVGSAIFSHAVAHGHISRNPWRDAKRTSSGVEMEEGVAYTEQDVSRIVTTLDTIAPSLDPREQFTCETAQMVIFVAFFIGCRPSELAALTWDCVNLDTNTFVIKQAFLHGQTKGTKTGQQRVVTIPAALAPSLNSRLRWWRTVRPAAGWVFPNSHGTAPINMNFTSGFVKRQLEKVGQEWEGLYSCRRGCITRWKLLGMTPEAIAQAVGNSVAIIFKHYFKDKECQLAATEMQRVAELMQQRQLKQLTEGQQ